mgnify:FL=1
MCSSDLINKSDASSGNAMRRTYAVPLVNMTDEDGNTHSSVKVFMRNQPIIMAFVYTSCTAVCPLTSAAMARIQDNLATDGIAAAMMSISIDPEFDNPKRLKSYAQRFGAGASWHHFTGAKIDMVALQKAFEAYYGDKNNHRPAIYVRGSKSGQWTRFDGYPSPIDVRRALAEN